MRRRFSSLALVIVGALAVRAAYWPMLPAEGSRDGGYGPPGSFADHGLQMPALIVAVIAALDLLASLAPASSALPRATAGRSGVWWVRLATWAGGLFETPIAALVRTVACVGGVFLGLLGLVAFVTPGTGGGQECASHLLLAVLVILRLPLRNSYDGNHSAS